MAADADAIEVGEDGARGLFADGNDEVVRAAALAARFLPEDVDTSTVLGVLARRAAAPCGAGKPGSLSLMVASAAVDSLIGRDTPHDREVLEELFEDLSRRDLVKRVGAAIGRDVEAAERDAQLRRAKAAAVRRVADPAPKQARAAADKLIRRKLAPVLQCAGFVGRGRRWVRVHPERVDAVRIESSRGEVWLTYGAWFAAAHHADDPFPVEQPSASRIGALDVELREDLILTDAGLERCADHLATVVIPFLDMLGRYELTRAYLDLDAGRPGQANRVYEPDSVDASMVLGQLALAVGDRPTAVARLERCLAQAEWWLARADDGDRADAERNFRFWSSRLDEARRLADDLKGR